MSKYILILLLFCKINFINTLDAIYEDELSNLNLITTRGYPVEIYSNIRTEDDYLLDLQRIPYGKGDNMKENKKKQSILLMHSMLTSGEIYVVAKRNLAFILADAGYDVWIGNTRGTVYSRKHVNLSTYYNSSYWNYSFHEKGYYDMPAFIDFILNVTGNEKIIVIGYSEGTTATYVLTSTRPEYNSKIKLFINIGPVVYLGNSENQFLTFVSPYVNIIRSIFLSLNLKGIYVEKEMLTRLVKMASASPIIDTLCASFFFAFGIYDIYDYVVNPCQYFGLILHGVSVNQFSHYGQDIRNNDFRRFDYGPRKNLAIYGKKIPPAYNLKQITIPIAFIYGLNDYFSTPKDMKRLLKILPNVVHIKKIPNCSHYDYMMHREIEEIVFDEVLKILKQYG